MTVVTEKFVRKPLVVDGVQVTPQNFNEVAAWCEGEVLQDETAQGSGQHYIKVRVENPKNVRQTKAFVGDWLLYTEKGGFKVYTNKAFRNSFESLEEKTEPSLPDSNEKDPAAQTPEESMARDKDWAAETPRQDEQMPAEPAGVQNNVPAMPIQADAVPNAPEQESIQPDAAAGRRVLSIREQRELTPAEIQELVRSGEAVLVQDLETPVESGPLV